MSEHRAGSLEATIERWCGAGEWVGVCYGHDETFWVRGARSRWERHTGKLDWASLFEARLFDGEQEVRWWREDESAGHAVRVDVPIDPDVAIRSWLLWGAADEHLDPSSNWVLLTEARIGTIVVPRPGGPRPPATNHIGLMVTERWDEDDHGNVSVADEVLTRLEWRRAGIDQE